MAAFQDLRFSLRLLQRDRTFSLIAVLTLALGIGATATVFAVFSSVLIRPLPFANGERLITLEPRWMGAGAHEADVISASDYFDFREGSGSIAHLAALEGSGSEITGEYVLKTREGAIYLSSGNVSANFFEIFPVRPILGRDFVRADEDVDSPRVIVLGEAIWRSRFGADPGVIGRSISLDGSPMQVVGVLPGWFRYPPRAEVWLPMSAGLLRKMPRAVVRAVQPVGVLAPGASVAGAQAELDVISRRLAERYPSLNGGRGVRVRLLRDSLSGELRAPLAMLLASTLVLLLIAALNVANLQMARAAARSRELSIRLALGAGRLRLIQQLLMDNLVLSLAGGILGIVIAWLAVHVLVLLHPVDSELVRSTSLDWRVLIGTAAIVVLTTLASGLLPALTGWRYSLAESLKEGSKAAGTHNRSSRALVAGEVMLAIVLVVCAGLMAESFGKLMSVNSGIDSPGRVATMLLTFPPSLYGNSGKRANIEMEILRRVKEQAGIQAAGMMYSLPTRGVTFTGLFRVEGRQQQPTLSTDIHWLSPGALNALGVPLLRGRLFTDREGVDPRSGVVIVNQEFAGRFLAGAQPVGQHVTFAPGAGLGTEEVIGVVGNVRHRSLTDSTMPAVYKPSLSLSWCYLVVRSTGSDIPVRAAVARAVSAAAADQPIATISSLEDVIAESVSGRRYRTVLVGVFAVMALVLASIGIYGVTAYSVTQRRREIAIRLAMGAEPGRVTAMVLREGALLVCAGAIPGALLALAAARAIASLLFEVNPMSPVVYGGALLVLGGVAMLACWVPALRAARVDPAVTLRNE